MLSKSSSESALSPGTWLGKHQLLHRLAVGGMAEIYLARATGIEQFEKLLVLKRMLPQYAGDHRFIRMFLDEARLAATLSHPNIAHVYDIGGGNGHYYFTMEYVHGQDLAAVLQASSAAGEMVPLAHALTIVAGVAAGLHAAHDRRGTDGALLGVVHRDVSPSNVLVGYDGCVKVVDFGIAKLAAQDGKTRTGGFVGKARYSSPEHVQGQPLDRRSDLFSLGIVLFELTCGRRPFDGDSDFAAMQAIVGGEPPRPSELVPGYPPALEDIVLRALRRGRDARFATAQELQLALEDFARQAQIALSSAALSAYMSALFDGKVSAWREARRAGRSLSDHVVATATGGTLDLAALDAMAPLAAAKPEVVALRDAPRRRSRASSRRWAMAVAAVAAIAGVAGAAWPVRAPDAPAAPTTAPRREPSAPARAPAPALRNDRAEIPPAPRSDAVAREPRAPTAAPVRLNTSNGKRAANPRPRASHATQTPTTPTPTAAGTRTTPLPTTAVSRTTPLPTAAVTAERAQPWNPDSPLEP